MQYTNRELGAVVGQLVVYLKQMNSGDIEPETWDNITSYTLSRVTGFSRYHVVNLLEIAVDKKLVVRKERPHRENAIKHCYSITEKGVEYVQRLIDSGEYVGSLEVIRHNHFMKANNTVVDLETSYLETMLWGAK